MPLNGWVKIGRDILNSPVWPLREPFSRFEFYLYLKLSACFQEQTVFNKRQEIVIQRGQMLTSWHRLSHDSHRSKNWVYGRLSEFERVGLVKRLRMGNQFSIITICDYDDYKSDTAPSGQKDEPAVSQTESQTDGQYIKKEKKEKNEKKNITFGDDVAGIIEHYEATIRPLRSKSPRRIAMITARLKTFPAADCIKAIDNVNASPFHSGQNSDGKIYKDFEMIFKSDDSLEKYLTMETNPDGKSRKRSRYYEALERHNATGAGRVRE